MKEISLIFRTICQSRGYYGIKQSFLPKTTNYDNLTILSMIPVIQHLTANVLSLSRVPRMSRKIKNALRQPSRFGYPSNWSTAQPLWSHSHPKLYNKANGHLFVQTFVVPFCIMFIIYYPLLLSKRTVDLLQRDAHWIAILH